MTTISREGSMARRIIGRPGGLITRRRGDELLILDTVKDQIHQLNRSATFIWGWMSVGG